MVADRLARIRLPVVLVLAGIAAVTTQPLAAQGEPGKPPPLTVATVTTRLDTLSRQVERLAEQYNRARIEVLAAQRAQRRAQHAAAAAAADYRTSRIQFITLITAQYESGPMRTPDALLSSHSGQDYVDRLQLLSLIADRQTAVVNKLNTTKGAAQRASKTAAAALQVAEAHRNTVKAERAKAAAQTTKFKTLLATLTARQQQAYTSKDAAKPTTTSSNDAAQPTSTTSGTRGPRTSVRAVHAGSAAAQRAVDFALAQLGKPYVFGAAGPSSYDCSGLTMAAWRAGGVSLPHLAADQYNYGTHVSASQLQPGDLIFLYNPIGHVSMYIGNGMLVSAPQTGENVKIVPFAYFKSDFVGATRLA